MNETRRTALGSILALLGANALLLAIGPQGAAAGAECEEDCWCLSDVCNEEEFAFEECLPGWTKDPETGAWVLDQTLDAHGRETGESCGGGN